jgi:hypothetical protein
MMARKELEKSPKGECSSAGVTASQMAGSRRFVVRMARGRYYPTKVMEIEPFKARISMDRGHFVAGEFSEYSGDSASARTHLLLVAKRRNA